jgi:ubiquinone biosynthesis protein COQ4
METSTFSALNHQRIVELPAFERWKRGLRALIEVGKDPDRTDKVLEAYEHLNAGTEGYRVNRFYSSPRAEQLFLEDRTLDATTLDFAALAKLPEGTFGNAYARFMTERGLTPDIFAAQGRLSRTAFVIKRLRQTHDLWHVLTGIGTDVPGELELQAFSFTQLRLPSAFILIAMGTLRWSWRHPSLPFRVLRGAFAGLRAEKLDAQPWEELWARPLVELRRELRC